MRVSLFLLTGSLVTGAATRTIRAASAPDRTASGSASADGYDASPADPIGGRILSLDEAVRTGLARNPQIAGAAAGVASSRASYQSIGAFPNLNLGITRVTGTSAAPTLTGTTTDTFLDFGETVDTSGQRRFQTAGAKAQYESARYQLEESRLTLTQQIRDAYWTLAANRAQTTIAAENLSEARQLYQIGQTRLSAGAAPQQDLIRSSIDLATAEQSYLMAQGAERSSVIAINTLLARPTRAPLKLADQLSELMATTADGVEPSGPDVLKLRALSTRPAVLAAKAQVRAASYAVKQARAGRLPDLAVDYERSTRQNVDTYVVGARFPLLDFGNVRFAVRSAAQAERQSRAQERQIEQQVDQQVEQAYLDYTQARTLLTSYRARILEPSTTLIDMAQLGYKEGATGILPVLDAEKTLRDARTGFITTLLSLYKAEDEVLAATGSLPGGPTAGVDSAAGPARARKETP